MKRTASHSGSWYTADGPKLYAELTSWLSHVSLDSAQPDFTQDNQPVGLAIEGCKAIIAPHAGYAYSGAAAAWAYKCIPTTGIKRVFILGPSHHVFLEGCAVSACAAYETPLGDLPLDRETISELQASGEFTVMDQEMDENEHSIEMHLPYIRKAFEGLDIQIVPILVGATPKAEERRYGALLAPFLARDDTFTVVSSDFCHWGSRFNYTFYYPAPLPLRGDQSAIRLSAANRPSPQHPIYASISDLDREGMAILEMKGSGELSCSERHDKFSEYIGRTKNTICGRHPIGVLLGAVTALQGSAAQDSGNRNPGLRWVRYEQSSQCISVKDSSVSYASAYVTF